MRIARHGPNEARALRKQILDVYESAWVVTRFAPTLGQLGDFDAVIERHVAQTAFRLVGAYDDAGGLAGFAYGYTSAPGSWWRDIVINALNPGVVERWFADAFEFVELAVRPDAQGRGVGGALHDALLHGIVNRTAVLSTQSENRVALDLYLGRSWVVIDRSFMFPNRSYPYTIMGLDLPHDRR